MKNSHFKLTMILLISIIFLSGCVNVATNNSSSESVTNTSIPTPTTTPTPIPNPTPEPKTTVYTKAEVAKHNSQIDCWMIIDARVYNVTAYVPNHPSGIKDIIKGCGKDASSMFNLQHKPNTRNLLASYFIGNLQ